MLTRLNHTLRAFPGEAKKKIEHRLGVAWRVGITALVAASSIVLPGALPASAATGNLYAAGLTAPTGLVWLDGNLGGHLWVSDHLQGFCRLDLGSDGKTSMVNSSTCQTSVTSPGQAAYDASAKLVYVPDNSSKSVGIMRYSFDPATERLVNAVVVAPNQGLSGNKPTAVALGPDQNLYVSFLKSGNILRVTNPSGASQLVQSVGNSSDGRRVASLAFVGSDLYLAETAAVTRIFNAASTTCLGGCVGTPAGINIVTPLSVAYDGNKYLYIGDVSLASRYDVTTGLLEGYASSGTWGTASVPFQNVSALGVDAKGNLFVGDDPTDGGQVFQGRSWMIPAGSPALPNGGGFTPPPPPPPPPPAAAVTTGALYAGGLTAPSGLIWLDGNLGGHLWVSDHAQGFCRLDLNTASQTYAMNAGTCQTSVTSPGQVAYDAPSKFLYVPDNSAKSQGVWRFRYDPGTEQLVDAMLLAPNQGLGGNRPAAVAVGPDANLYVSFLKNGNIVRITNPAGISQSVQSAGRSADGRRVMSMAFADKALYLAESAQVTRIADISSPTCTGGCVGSPVNTGVTAPLSVAYDVVSKALFIGDPSMVIRYNLTTGVRDLYANSGTYNGTSYGFRNVSSLAVDAKGNLFAGDDPSDGTQVLQGRIWIVAKPA